MKAYLSTLNEREKWMLAGALFGVLLYIFYLFLYSPLSDAVTLKNKQLIEKTNTLAWMQKVRLQNRASQPKQVVDNSQLLTIMATSLKEDSSLKFAYQLQQTGSGEIQLTFDTVAFNLFLTWLEKISKQYAITIKQFDAERTGTPGVTHLVILVSASSTKS